MLAKLQIEAIPALNDNYIWLLHNGQQAVVVDPTLAAPVQAFLKQHNLTLVAVLLTHQHADHCGGVAELLQVYPQLVVVDNFQLQYLEQTKVQVAEWLDVTLIPTPGHTHEHVVYYINEQHLFCGDCLFSLGCGRVFTQDFALAYDSLTKIKSLPAITWCYPAHEYTLANLRFSLSIMGNLDSYSKLAREIADRLTTNRCSLPVSLAQELKYNLFLRCDDPKLWSQVMQVSAKVVGDEFSCFYQLRSLRNQF